MLSLDCNNFQIGNMVAKETLSVGPYSEVVNHYKVIASYNHLCYTVLSAANVHLLVSLTLHPYPFSLKSEDEGCIKLPSQMSTCA